MKNKLTLAFMFLYAIVSAQKREIIENKGDTLVFINQDPGLAPVVKKGLTNVYFQLYPKLTSDFNPMSPRKVEVKIDTSMDGVAYTNSQGIFISSKWLQQHPNDTDLFTHELMHVVQAYPGNSGPGWLTEGIADYVRYKYGLKNTEAKWSLTPFSSKQSYTDSYRITARFLEWLTEKYDKNLVKRLDQNMRNETYSANLWKKYTGKSLDELWQIYSANPDIS